MITSDARGVALLASASDTSAPATCQRARSPRAGVLLRAMGFSPDTLRDRVVIVTGASGGPRMSNREDEPS